MYLWIASKESSHFGYQPITVHKQSNQYPRHEKGGYIF